LSDVEFTAQETYRVVVTYWDMVSSSGRGREEEGMDVSSQYYHRDILVINLCCLLYG